MAAAMQAAFLRPGAALGAYPERDGGEDDRWAVAPPGPALSRRGLARFTKAVRCAAPLGGHNDVAAAAADLRRELVRNGLTDTLLVRAFALIRHVAGDAVGMTPRDCQIMAGRVMAGGALAEMQTGEGKTLAATLPACTAALAGIPVHVITANDYLAARDATAMGPVYRALGLSVGSVTSRTPPEQRRAAYRRDVIYTTSKQLAFDYLRDRIAMAGRRGALRLAVERLGRTAPVVDRLTLQGLCFAIVDEADSVLIDEAKTPFVIAREVDGALDADVCRAALEIADKFVEGQHYSLDMRSRRVALTAGGRLKSDDGGGLLSGTRAEREALIAQAVAALRLYRIDRDYLVRDGQVQIIDPNTGRVLPDRSWERGLHQLIEVKEGCETTAARETLASLTFQRLFPRYLVLGGMTGTAREVSGELQGTYGLGVVAIPTHRPSQRRALPAKCFATAQQKIRAIVEEAAELSAAGRPVLIGTRSVEDSERIAQALEEAGLSHTLLNARQDAGEASIVARAGGAGAITVATNMAGRGTDIVIGKAVSDIGGLHVIVSAPNDVGRLDRQLIGRCARQGEPGSWRRYVSSEDDIVVSMCPRTLRRTAGSSVLMSSLLIRLAQWRCELHQRSVRAELRTMQETYDRLLALAGTRD